MRTVRARRLAAIALGTALGVTGARCDDVRQRVERGRRPAAPEETLPASVRGRLALSLHGPGGEAPAVVHRSTWVRSGEYLGMEDNDLRGFLDGRFLYGWNQPGQTHTRLGRRGSAPRWAETELYRTLQRWAGIALPAGARVREAELVLHVEHGPHRALPVMLYAVLGDDWQPGRGGAPGHNNAPPERGDVWWGSRAEGVQPWGLPGAGYAASDRDADTPPEPLAETVWEHGAQSLAFRSDALAAYAERRSTRGEPLLFLVKLADAYEDEPGTMMALRSASADDAHSLSRRPHLALTWEDPAPRARIVRDVHLESGRLLALPRLEAAGARLAAASFEPAAGHEAPTVLVRGGRAGEAPSDWRPLLGTFAADWAWLEARVVAAQQPVELGQPFTTEFRDTWVRSAPPEGQRVPYTFVSPQGEHTTVEASYAGDWTWTVRFVPYELGRWRYSFESAFVKGPVRSATASFDVVALERESILRGLGSLRERARIEAAGDAPAGGVSHLARAFWKLERAALQLETPEHWRSDEGLALRALLDDVRKALSGRRVPRELTPAAMERPW